MPKQFRRFDACSCRDQPHCQHAAHFRTSLVVWDIWVIDDRFQDTSRDLDLVRPFESARKLEAFTNVKRYDCESSGSRFRFVGSN